MEPTKFRKTLGSTTKKTASQSRKIVAGYIGQVTKRKAFRVSKIVSDIFNDIGVSAVAYARAMNTRDVVRVVPLVFTPCLPSLQSSTNYMSSIKSKVSERVVDALFGPDAFWGALRLWREKEAVTLANDVIELVVNAELSQLKRTAKAIERSEVTVAKAWESKSRSSRERTCTNCDCLTEVEAESKAGIDKNKGKIIAALRQYTKATNIAIAHREAFGLKEDVERAAELADRLDDIKKTMSRSQDITGRWS